MTLRFSKTASNHLSDIYQFIAIDSNADSAAQEIEKVLRSIDLLTTHPMLGRSGQMAGTRELISEPYVIIYRLIESVVSVEAVFHGKRRYTNLPK